MLLSRPIITNSNSSQYRGSKYSCLSQEVTRCFEAYREDADSRRNLKTMNIAVPFAHKLCKWGSSIAQGQMAFDEVHFVPSDTMKYDRKSLLNLKLTAFIPCYVILKQFNLSIYIPSNPWLLWSLPFYTYFNFIRPLS